NKDWIYSVHHDSSPRYVQSDKQSIGAKVAIKLRTGLGSPIDRIYLRTCPDGEQEVTRMNRVGKDSVCEWWEGQLKLSMPRVGYRFLLLTSDGGWWFNA